MLDLYATFDALVREASTVAERHREEYARINAMPAGPEMDLLVERRVLGYGTEQSIDARAWSTDPTSALYLAEHTRQWHRPSQGSTFLSLDAAALEYRYSCRIVPRIYNAYGSVSPGVEVYRASGPTLALAVARAALMLATDDPDFRTPRWWREKRAREQAGYDAERLQALRYRSTTDG